MAYIKSKPNLNKNFHFKKTFVFRENVEEYIEQCKNSDILLCSCYVWNWETIFLGRWITKFKIHPSSLSEIRQVFQYGSNPK